MLTSANWINQYLDPPATPEEQAELLTRVGFPLEGSEPVESGDVRQDYEMTSNRGDCVSHLGLAREIAAISGRTLKIPEVTLPGGGPPAADIVKVINREPDLCPLYTARVIRGITVKPSPDWLAGLLRARGDVPRNNVVDATNFVQFEWGQPTHVFDLDLLRDKTIIIRRAAAGELFLPLGEGESEIELIPDDLVIADAERAVALGGVKGGGVTAVTESTSDILIEAATFHPVTIRNTSRRHNIATDSSYRYERGVHPGQINAAADRLTALILELAGGELCEGVVADGKAIPECRRVSMRTDRCRKIMGVPIDDAQMVDGLARLGFQPTLKGERIDCVVPLQRLDVEREIDIIEEVGRMYGHDRIPVEETIEIRVAPLQPAMIAKAAVSDALVGLGYLETVTHTLVDEVAATCFMPEGAEPLRVDDDRAKAWPILQPSILPSLMRVRERNHANGIEQLKLFQTASTFWREAEGHREVVRIGLLCDFEDEANGLRPLRGTIERLLHLLLGPQATVQIRPDDVAPWYAPGAMASIGDKPLGRLGVISPDVATRFGLDMPLLAAELDLPELYGGYPPQTEAHALTAFPPIERDVSAILGEDVTWLQLEEAIGALALPELEAVEYITVFRGEQIGAGRKSLSLRLRFRAADRTLTHDEVDPFMQRVIESLKRSFDAEIRR